MTESRATKPIYHGTRRFLGLRDLVVSFYTKKCQFECSYCALPLRSSNDPVSVDDLNSQIDTIFSQYAAQLPEFQQFCFGNEGSALDSQRFHRESLSYVLDRAQAMTNLEVISLETRPEYIRRERLEEVRSRTHARVVDMTVGFETQDDEIRIGLLRKKTFRRLMEERIRLLVELGIRFTSYVMIKPAPGMTEEAGVREAIATIEYLADVCARFGTSFVAYLTPTYIAEGSHLARTTKPGEWVPPTIQSVLRVAAAGWRMGVPTYSGLWSEGLAEDGYDFRGREGYDPAIRQALLKVNQTGDPSHLQPFRHIIDAADELSPAGSY